MVSVTCQNVSFETDGRILINWTDGNQSEFTDRAAVQAAEDPVDAERLRQIAVAMWKARNPGITDPSFINGRTFQFDASLDLNPFSHGVVI